MAGASPSARTESRPQTIGELVSAARRERGWTREHLARRSRIATRTLYRVEGDQVTPRDGTLHLIASALGIEPERLVDTAHDNPPPK